MVSRHTTLLVCFGVLVVVLVAGISRIELKENWLEPLDVSYEFRRSTDFLRENFTGVETYEYSLGAGRAGGNRATMREAHWMKAKHRRKR